MRRLYLRRPNAPFLQQRDHFPIAANTGLEASTTCGGGGYASGIFEYIQKEIPKQRRFISACSRPISRKTFFVARIFCVKKSLARALRS